MARPTGLAGERIAGLQARITELEALFDLQWEADQRAIERWQAAHPEREHVWPDRADMVVWLMDGYAALTAERDRLAAVLRSTHDAYCNEPWTSRGLHAPECLLYEVEP